MHLISTKWFIDPKDESKDPEYRKIRRKEWCMNNKDWYTIWDKTFWNLY